ncbi:MAG: hypothetical protein ACE5DI_04345 [Candidatus Micrarchaeia archaeon]
MTKISVAKNVSPDLALRASANRFFDYLESLPENQLVVDFQQVQTISRSFAHQYLLRKKKSPKRVSETNVPESVEKMFEVVQASSSKRKIIDLTAIRVITI